MEATVIDWDGNNVPPELRLLPPGRYVLAPLDDSADLTPEEDAAVRQGLDEFEAGDVVSFDEVVRAFEARFHHA